MISSLRLPNANADHYIFQNAGREVLLESFLIRGFGRKYISWLEEESGTPFHFSYDNLDGAGDSDQPLDEKKSGWKQVGDFILGVIYSE